MTDFVNLNADNSAAQLTAQQGIQTNTGNLDTNLGARADAVAPSDTGTSSLIALIKRALQTLTTMAGSLASIVTNTSGNAVSATADATVVTAVTTASTTLQTANATTKEVLLWNKGAVNVFVQLGSTATVAGATYVIPPGIMAIENYAGLITAIVSAGSGSVAVTRKA